MLLPWSCGVVRGTTPPLMGNHANPVPLALSVAACLHCPWHCRGSSHSYVHTRQCSAPR